ncbi:N-acetylmuramoyl-L-alanine amidase [Gramella sp. BOM4]|nr:N-acetylmuramoyl-L-alanine amidase [Christiangramia bathymodioli]
MKNLLIVLLAAILVSGCSSNPYSKTNRLHKKQVKQYAKELKEFPIEDNGFQAPLNYGPYEVGTTNFNLRKPNFVVIHHTAQDSVRQTLTTFTIPRTQVSSHYVIDDNGEIYHMLNDYFRAWHGGVGKWGNTNDLNSASIGIELDNDGKEEFSIAQINSLLKLLKELKEKYKIPQANFIGHSDIAPTRKVDPHAGFPWERLAEEGFGYWYDEEKVRDLVIEKDLPKSASEDSLAVSEDIQKPTENRSNLVPKNFDPIMALRIIGYDVSDPVAAKKAFKLHFIQQEDTDAELTDFDLKVLYNLYQKYL